MKDIMYIIDRDFLTKKLVTKTACAFVAMALLMVVADLATARFAFASPTAAQNSSSFFGRLGNMLGLNDDDHDSANKLRDQANYAGRLNGDAKGENNGASNPAEITLASYQHSSNQKDPTAVLLELNADDLGSGRMESVNNRLYQRIFQLQSHGRWDDADALINRLDDPRLMGYVLHQRYMHPTAYQSSPAELTAWMTHYADLPVAKDIYKLAKHKLSAKDFAALQEPKLGRKIQGLLPEINSRADKNYKARKSQSAAQRRAIANISRKIDALLNRGAPSRALQILKASSAYTYMDAAQQDQLIGQIAKSYYHLDKFDLAHELSTQAASRSGVYAPMASWIAGLTTWQKGDFKQSAAFFEKTGGSPYADDWSASAGAYWAARAHLKAKNFAKISPWMEQAAAHKRTFYGLIANRALGKDINLNWDVPRFSKAHERVLREYKSGWRALALLELNQIEQAQEELIHLNPGRSNYQLREALVALAQSYKLPELALRMGSAYSDKKGQVYEAALYPMMAWQPPSGYEVDRALIHAFIRQESRFNTGAQSHSGATGLMQLMLATASYVDGERIFKEHNRYLLEHPSTNLDLGQKYIKKLLRSPNVKNDLLSLAVSYNAGPGNLARWKEKFKDAKSSKAIDDPLLFIENIPLGETRIYVERVLSNYWLYRMRMNQETPSLDDIAQDNWPLYYAQDNDIIRLASAQ